MSQFFSPSIVIHVSFFLGTVLCYNKLQQFVVFTVFLRLVFAFTSISCLSSSVDGFNLVNHHALLNELRLLNVHAAIIRWISAFLTECPQCVRIADSVSTAVFPHGGIPQGIKLAPLLFAILVNCLVSSWRYCYLRGHPTL